MLGSLIFTLCHRFVYKKVVWDVVPRQRATETKLNFQTVQSFSANWAHTRPRLTVIDHEFDRAFDRSASAIFLLNASWFGKPVLSTVEGLSRTEVSVFRVRAVKYFVDERNVRFTFTDPPLAARRAAAANNDARA
jgi:hypothetical protein